MGGRQGPEAGKMVVLIAWGFITGLYSHSQSPTGWPGQHLHP